MLLNDKLLVLLRIIVVTVKLGKYPHEAYFLET